MQGQEWINMLELIPKDQHNQLVVLTNNRVELAIELLLRMDLGHMVFRGRVCGQNDDGRLFFLPYDQITYINLNRFVKEDEFREILGIEPEDELTAEAEPEAFVPPPPPVTVPAPQPATTSSGYVPRLPAPIPPSATRMAPPAPAAATPPPPTGSSLRIPTVTTTVAVAPPPPPVTEPAGPKSSILERLRAQRTAMKGPSR